MKNQILLIKIFRCLIFFHIISFVVAQSDSSISYVKDREAVEKLFSDKKCSLIIIISNPSNTIQVNDSELLEFAELHESSFQMVWTNSSDILGSNLEVSEVYALQYSDLESPLLLDNFDSIAKLLELIANYLLNIICHESFQLSLDKLEKLEKMAPYIKNPPLLAIAVTNNSFTAHQTFANEFFSIGQSFPDKYNYKFGYMNIHTQFQEVISFEIYRRHLPTFFVYNISNQEYFLSYVKLGKSNKTAPKEKIAEEMGTFLKNVANEEESPLKKGFFNFYYKLYNLNYLNNNFYIVFNYILGIGSLLFIIIVFVFEKQILKLTGGRRSKKETPTQKGREDEATSPTKKKQQ